MVRYLYIASLVFSALTASILFNVLTASILFNVLAACILFNELIASIFNVPTATTLLLFQNIQKDFVGCNQCSIFSTNFVRDNPLSEKNI